MGCRQLLELFKRETLEACVDGMSKSLQAGKTHPTTQGLRINGEHVTTIGERNKGHNRRSFRVRFLGKGRVKHGVHTPECLHSLLLREGLALLCLTKRTLHVSKNLNDETGMMMIFQKSVG